MSDDINRRDVLKGIGTTTAASIAGASIVSATPPDEASTGTLQDGHASMPDLKVRSFVREDARTVDVSLRRTNTGGPQQEIASETVTARPMSEMQKPRYFDFQIPHGEYLVEVTEDGELLESMEFDALQTGYPEYRQLAVKVRDDETELYENVI